MDIAARRAGASTRPSCAGATSSRTTVPVPDAGGADLRQRQLRPGAGARAGDGGLRPLPAAASGAGSRGATLRHRASSYIEACGLARRRWSARLGAQAGLYECATVRIHPTGKVTVLTGSHSHGQGHETTFAQVVADFLGIPIDRRGDRARRHRASPLRDGELRQPQRRGGRHGDLQEPGEDRRQGAEARRAPARGVARRHRAHRADGSASRAHPSGEDLCRGQPRRLPGPQHAQGHGARAGGDHASSTRPTSPSPSGRTSRWWRWTSRPGRSSCSRYIAVDDVGNVINPMIVDGQLHGGIAQGAAQALWEWATYDDCGSSPPPR